MKPPSAQINVDYGSERVASLDRIAAEQGLTRPELLRRVADMFIAAHEAGHDPFAPDPNELGIGDVVTMKAAMEEALMEIDRIARHWARHEAGLRKAERDDQQALSLARAEFIEGIPERIRQKVVEASKAFDGFLKRVEQVLDTRLLAHTAALEANTAAIERIEKQPRTVLAGLILGDGRVWSTVFVIKWSLLMVGLGAVLLGGIGTLSPGIGVPLAHKLVAGDAEFCRLVRYRFEIGDCQVPRRHWVPEPPDGETSSARTKLP